MELSQHRIKEIIREELTNFISESDNKLANLSGDILDQTADSLWQNYWIPAKPVVKIARSLGMVDHINPADKKQIKETAKKISEIQKKGISRIKEGSLDWEKNFKWAKTDELKVIQFLIGMSHGGISDVIKDMKKNPSAFKSFVKDLSKQGLYEGFAGAMKEGDRKEFEKIRKQQAEVLGYTLTGKSDVKSDIGDATIKESANPGQKLRVQMPDDGSSFKTHFEEDDEDKEKVDENRVRISTMKDANFHNGIVQLVGKKGRVAMDRKSLRMLVYAVKKKMGSGFTSFREGKINESTVTLPNGIKVKLDFSGITLQQSGSKPVFLDRKEMMTFFKATSKYMKIKEGKLTEDKFIAFYKKDRVTVNAKSLWDAKKQIIAKLKVPKKDVGLVSVLNKTEYDKQKFRFEGKLNEGKLTTTFYFDQSKYINKIRNILAKYKGGAKAFKFMGNSKPKHMVVGGHKMKMSGKKATMWNGIPNNKVKEAEKFFKSHGLQWLKTQQNFPNMRPIMKVEGKLNEEKYVVASVYGDLYTPKAVSRNVADKLMMKLAKQYAGDNVFVLGAKYWNKPHKYNKKKIMAKEVKLSEDYKNNEWEVYTKDEKGREKIVKKAKSKRAATILYNKIIKSDDYWEVGMRVIKEGKLNEAKYKTISLKTTQGYKEAEKLQKQGWVVKHVGLFTIDMVKEGVNEEKLNEFNKAHFLNLIKQEIESLKGQIAYANDNIRAHSTPKWEKKEWLNVLKDLNKKLKDTEKHYKRVEKLKEEKLTEKKPWQGYEKHAVHGKAKVDFLNLISGHPDWKKYNKLTDKGRNVIFFTKKDKQPLVWQISNGRDVQATDLKGSKSSYKSYKVGDIYKVLVEGVADEIRRQIPKRTLSYVGAKNFAKGKSPKGEFLEFSVKGSRLKTGGKIKVIYNKGGDDYIIEAWQIRGMNAKLIKKHERIQVSKLGRTYRKFSWITWEIKNV